MAKIIGYVKVVDGIFKAESKNGKVHILKVNDPIYADDAIFGKGNSDLENQNSGTGSAAEQSYISISLNNGENVILTGEDYLLFDSSVLGKNSDLSPFDLTMADFQHLRHDGEDNDKQSQQTASNEADIFTSDYELENTPEIVTPVFSSSAAIQAVDLSVAQNQSSAILTGEDKILLKPESGHILDAVNDNATVTEDSTEAVTGNLILNDSVSDNGHAQVTAINGSPEHIAVPVTGEYGSVIVGANGGYSYQLNNSNPAIQALAPGDTITDTFTYTVSDEYGGTDTARLTITINGSNDAPVAVNDSNSIDENTTVSVAGDVFGNDGDVDGGTLRVSAVDGTSSGLGQPHNGLYGSVTLNTDGSYSYQLDNSNPAVQALAPGETLTDTFTYTVSDGHGGTDNASLIITINGTNDAPVIDLDGDNSSAGGNNYQDTFTENGAAIAIADSDSTITDPDDSNMESATVVLTNAQSGDSLDTSGVDGSFNANLDTSTAGEITVILSGSHSKADYSAAIAAIKFSNPNEDLSGVDRVIHVTINDGDSNSNAAISTIHVTPLNDVPVAADDSHSVNEDAAAPATGNVMTNDSDVDGDALTVTGVNGISGNVAHPVSGHYGSVTVNPDGSYSYQVDDSNVAVDTLTPGETLTDTFTYTVSDGHGGTDNASLIITINGTNDAPVIDLDGDNSSAGGNNYQDTFTENGTAIAIADSDSTITDPDDSNVESATVVLTNAQSGDSLDTSGVDGSFNANLDTSVGGQITVTLSGSHSKADYSAAIAAIKFSNPNEDLSGVDRVIHVTTNDGDSNSNTAISTIHVAPINDAPTTDNVAAIGDKDATYIAITLTASDVDSAVSHFKLDSLPANGTLYTDSALTHVVNTTEDYVATANQLTLYFKPRYDGTTFGPDTYQPVNEDVTFAYKAKDVDSSDGITYGSTATATITIDDVPYAAEAADRNVVENYANSLLRHTSGNVLTDGADFDHGVDYQSTHGDNPADVTMIQYTDSSGGYSAPVAITTGTDEGSGNYSFAVDYGKLVINADGSYTFTPDSDIDHGIDGNSVDFKFKYAIQDGDGDLSNFAEQVIHILDGEAPTIGVPTDVVLNEKDLPRGTDPHPADTTQSGDIDASVGTDTMDVVFNTVQTELDSKITAGLSSGGSALNYFVSADGHTLTANNGTSDVFVVTITNPYDSSSGYQFELLKSLDHETPVVDGNDGNGNDYIDFTFDITAADNDDPANDFDTDTFNVRIIDDNPANQNVTTDEDVAVTFNTNADASGSNTEVYDGSDGHSDNRPEHGTAVVNPDGTITYTPYSGENYSGPDSFTYTSTLDDGTVTDTTVDITVNPVADTPVWAADKTGADSLHTNEDTLVDLGLTLPMPTDNIDRHSPTGDGIDEPEHLGLITLDGVPVGAQIYQSDGTTLVWESTYGNNGTAKIRIDDNGTGTWDSSDLHYDGVSGEDILLTTAQFEGLRLLPVTDSGVNIDNITLSVQSYEVDAFGEPAVGVAASGTATQHIDIDVQAVTDPITVTKAGDASGTEDGWIRIDNTIMVTHGDTDGSESFTFKVDGADLTDGTKYRVDGGTVFDASTGIVVDNYTPDATRIEILTPPNDSNDISGLTISVEMTDSDTDSGGVITTESDSVDIAVNVTPIANDLTVSGGGSGNEDSKIDMGITFAGSDGNEEVEYVTIAGVPDGAKIYESDGTTLVFTGDGSTNLIVDITGVNPAGENPVTSRDYSLSEVSGFKILPPQDSNVDILLDVTINTRDYDDNDTSQTVAGSDTTTLNIQVAGVVDTSDGDHDTADAGHLYVELGSADGQAVIGDGTVTDFGHVNEDTAVDLHAFWQSYESRTDGTDHPVATSDNSETATFLIRNVTDSTSFTVVDGSGTVIGTQTAVGWELNAIQLADAQVKAEANFSGELNLELVTTVSENGDDPVYDENSQIDHFKITVDSVTDAPYLTVREVFTQEDTPVKLDIRPISQDSDGSESLVSIKIDNVPDGAVLKIDGGDGIIGNGDDITVWLNDSGGTTSHTFTINDTSISIGTRGADGSSNITEDALHNLIFTPPAHASGDIALQVTSTMQDGTAAAASTTQTLTVHVQGVADAPVLELSDIASGDADAGIRVNGTDIGDGGTSTYHDGDTVVVFGKERIATGDSAIPLAVLNASGETVTLDVATDMTPSYPHAAYPGDSSETITFVLEGLPSDFHLIDDGDNTIGSFVTLSGGTTTWTLTATEVANGVYIQAPVDYSGTVSGLKYTAVVTETDGHSSSRELPFSLEINPVISTTDPVQNVTGVEDAAPDGTAHGTLIDLDFSHVADVTGSEITTHVTINDTDIPAGLELYVQDGGHWVRADSLSSVYDGTTYDLSSYVDKTAVGIVGGTLENVAGTFTINNVQVTVTDGNENGNSNTVTENFTDSIVINLDGVADLPSITASGTDGVGNIHDLNINVTFPDMDGSESHYITIDTQGSNYVFNHGEQIAPDQWQFTSADMVGLQVEMPDDVTASFTAKAYAVENNTEIASTTFEVTDTAGGSGGGGTYTPQDPSLAFAATTLQPDEDMTFALNSVVDSSGTHLNNNDGGSEVLSFVVSDLASGSTIVSTDIAINVKEIIAPDGGTTYTFAVPDGMTVNDALARVEVTPPADFSGDFNFTVKAVATETADTFNHSAIISGNAHVEVQPVADTFTLDASAMTTTIVEDSLTQVKCVPDSSDSHIDANDHSEMVYYDGLGGSDMMKISVTSGNLVFSDGSQIEVDNDIDVRINGGIAQYDAGGGNWQDVYFKPPDQESGSYDITVKAHTHDATDFASGGSVTSTSGVQTQTITVTVNSDPDAADESGDPNGGNDTITADNVTSAEDTAVQLNISVTDADTDGSELHAIVVTGLPDGSILQDSSGDLVGTNSGNGTWALAPADLTGLYLQPPQNYSGTLVLSVENRVIETDNMTVLSTTSDDFTVTVAPIADGAIITPHNASGNEDEYIHIDLEMGSNEAEQNASSAVPGTPPGDEHYQVLFDGIHENVNFYWKDNSNVYHHLADENGGDSSDYLISNLTQEQVDNLYTVIGDNLTGTFNYGVHVATQEVDSSNTVVDTSAAVDGHIAIEVNVVPGDDTITGTAGDDTLYGHSGNDIIDGGAGADTILAGSGDDTITFDPVDTIDGGSGTDTLILSDGGSINFDATAIARLDNIEQIDLGQNGDHTLDSLSINDLIDITDANNELTILGDSGDTVNLQNGDGGDWSATGTVSENGHTFAVYDLSTDAEALTLKVEDTITQHIV